MGCICPKPKAESPKTQLTKIRTATINSEDKLKLTSPPSNIHVQPEESNNDHSRSRFPRPADPIPVPSNPPKSLEAEQIAAGWPAWLAAVAGEAVKGWKPRRAESFDKMDKIGQGTYSNVYKARDLETGKLVALKKVRFDNLEPESVRFMAREIEVLRRLDHPNIIKLEGLVTSKVSCSLYLVFEYMEHDLAGLAACPGVKFTEAQVKCYMKQLLSGLEHCHTRGVLHRDIKGSNLLLDNKGILKIADFGLATFYRPEQNVPLTSRVVTLWYRPPELLLGATNYGVAVDLWSSGCILAELLAGKPIMPGRTEVEQLHKIFKLCGSPSEEYWRKSRLPHATIFKPTQPYKRSLSEVFKDFPPSSLALLETLLSIEPADRGSATQALATDFFHTKPLPCDPISLPQYPPSKEYDAKLRDEENRRQRGAASRTGRNVDNNSQRRNSGSQRPSSRAIPAPHANAELADSISIQKQNMARQSGVPPKSKSEKFPVQTNDHSGNHGSNVMLHQSNSRRDSSPIQPGQSRGQHNHERHSLISKSGPQPMAGKPATSSGPASAWTQLKTNSGPQEALDVRMAPSRIVPRNSKSATAPDFAIQSGYADAKGRHGETNGRQDFPNFGIKKSRDRERERDRDRERERDRDRERERWESMEGRRDRSSSEPSQESSRSRSIPPSIDVRPQLPISHSGQLIRPSPNKDDREMDSSLPPPPWHSSRRGHSGPLQSQRSGLTSLSDKRFQDQKAWMGNPSPPTNGVVEEASNSGLVFPPGALPNSGLPGTAGALAAALANEQKKYKMRAERF